MARLANVERIPAERQPLAVGLDRDHRVGVPLPVLNAFIQHPPDEVDVSAQTPGRAMHPGGLAAVAVAAIGKSVVASATRVRDPWLS